MNRLLPCLLSLQSMPAKRPPPSYFPSPFSYLIIPCIKMMGVCFPLSSSSYSNVIMNGPFPVPSARKLCSIDVTPTGPNAIRQTKNSSYRPMASPRFPFAYLR